MVEAAEAHTEDDVLVEVMEGLALSTIGRKEEALEVLEAALKNYPTNTAAALQVVRLLMERYLNDERATSPAPYPSA